MPSSTSSFLYSIFLLSACGSLPSLRQARRAAPAKFLERAYSPKFTEGCSPNFVCTGFYEVRTEKATHPMSRLRRVLSQVGGIGLARLNDSPLSEASMIPECEDCTRLSADAGHSSIAFSRAAVLTTRCRASTSSVNL